jgi:hypothetical protein
MSTALTHTRALLAPALPPAPRVPPSGATAELAAGASEEVSFKTWVAVVGSTLGAFLAILNIQVVGASLADIQGGIGAGIDDGGWITTSYLIAEIIVIPLSGWLASVFSLRAYLLTSTAVFLGLTAACAFAQNLGQMIADASQLRIRHLREFRLRILDVRLDLSDPAVPLAPARLQLARDRRRDGLARAAAAVSDPLHPQNHAAHPASGVGDYWLHAVQRRKLAGDAFIR